MVRTLAAGLISVGLILGAGTTALRAEDISSKIDIVLRIGKEGAGHATAVPVLKDLVQQPASALLPLLRGMDQANPLAENWLRGAFEAIADKNLKSGNELPMAELEAFLLDRTHAVQPRKLAYDWSVRVDPTAEDRLVPGMIDDPSPEFRRDAVQRLIDRAVKAGEAKDAAGSKTLYLQAFDAALDPDQLDLAFDALTVLGEKPDLTSQLGLLDHWWLIGPFDHRNGIGFDAVYPPEEGVNLEQEYAGTNRTVEWTSMASEDRHAVFDLNKMIAPHKGAVMYAYCEFKCDQARDVEIRLGTPNGWKLWVNGELAFAHEEYHQSMRMDQYRTGVSLKAGANTILLKICQNEQTEDWAQRWEFQVRVCDATGAAVRPQNDARIESSSAAAN